MAVTQGLPVAGAILTLIVWGHLADRIGNRAIFVFTTAGTALATLVWLFVVPHDLVSQIALTVSTFASGALTAGFGIATSRFLFGWLPRDNKSGYTTTHTVITGVVSGLGTFLAGVLLRAARGFQIDLGGLHVDQYQLLFGAAGVALLVPMVLLARLRAPGEASTREFLSFLLSRPLRTTVSLIQYHRALDEERRAEVTRYLAHAASAVTVRELINGLDDPSFEVREAAAHGLAARREPDVIAALLAKLAEAGCARPPGRHLGIG